MKRSLHDNSHAIKTTILLASTSPRRAALLREAGYAPIVCPPREDAEDGRRDGESPTAMVARLARQKAESVVSRPWPRDAIVVACDTVVVGTNEIILGKPRDRTDARRMLLHLQGTTQDVVSGLALRRLADESMAVATAVTQLAMTPLTESAIDDYLDSGLWEGKAGGFGYQDRHGWLTRIAGSESNIVGLPMELFATMLSEMRGTTPLAHRFADEGD